MEKAVGGVPARPAGDHLLECRVCLDVLDMILLAEGPATAEEEADLR